MGDRNITIGEKASITFGLGYPEENKPPESNGLFRTLPYYFGSPKYNFWIFPEEPRPEPCPTYRYPFWYQPKPCYPRPDTTWSLPPIYLEYPSNENKKIVDFINDRAGKQVISVSVHASIEVSRGKANDGEMKIRIVNNDLFSDAPAVRLIIVRADGTIYEEDLEENRVKISELSREDASALIAALYGKNELGIYTAPSDKHIESVKNAVADTLMVGAGTLFDVFGKKKRESEPRDCWDPYFPIYPGPSCYDKWFDYLLGSQSLIPTNIKF